jgi:hypothetical protein
VSPRDRLVRAWDALEAQGAVVHRLAVATFTDGQVDALAAFEEARLRAITEGLRAGWTPEDGS